MQGKFRVVPGRLVRTGTELGARLPGTGEGVAATPAAVVPVTRPPPTAGHLLPSGFAGRLCCARPLAVHLPSAVSGLIAHAKGLWTPGFRAIGGRFVTVEEGVEL